MIGIMEVRVWVERPDRDSQERESMEKRDKALKTSVQSCGP